MLSTATMMNWEHDGIYDAQSSPGGVVILHIAGQVPDSPQIACESTDSKHTQQL